MWQEESVVRWTVYGPPGVDRVLSAAPVTARISASRLPTSRPTARIAWEQFIAPGLFAREAPDVLLCPLNVAPLMTPCPIVLVIHDLAFIRLRLHRRERRLYLSALTRLSVRKAAHIIAVSDFTRGEIIDLFGIAPEKVTTIHNGCDERFSAATKESMEAFRLRRNLPERFLLFVGTLEPRKNLIGLLRAYAKIRDKIGLPLIIVGGRGWRYTPIFALVHAERLDGAVRFEGFVDDEDLPMYYRAATALIYQSLYEGFGLPPLEAMASGTPVLTTRVASMPEVVGDAAMLVSPGDDDALADAMFKISSDERLRDDLIKAGLKRVEQFNWARTAVETLRILHDAAGTAF
jgi:glycosyltransferase involved in cell wall biosynthesis